MPFLMCAWLAVVSIESISGALALGGPIDNGGYLRNSQGTGVARIVHVEGHIAPSLLAAICGDWIGVSTLETGIAGWALAGVIALALVLWIGHYYRSSNHRESKRIQATGVQTSASVALTILEHLPVGVLIADEATGIVESANPQAASMCQCTPHMMIGRHRNHFSQALEAECQTSALESAGLPWKEGKLLRADGSQVAVLKRVNQVFVGWEKKVVEYWMDSVARNVTAPGGGEESAAQQEKFRMLLLRLSVGLLLADDEALDVVIREALGKVGCLLHADRSCTFTFDHALEVMDKRHEWCGQDIPERASVKRIPFRLVPELVQKLLGRETVSIRLPAELPSSWQAERQFLEKRGVRSVLAIPLSGTETVDGFVAFETVTTCREWQADEKAMLQVFADLMSSRLAKRKAEQARQRVEDRLAMVLEGSGDGFWDWNLQTNEFVHSARWASMLGYEPGQLGSHASTVRQLLHPDDYEGAFGVFQEHLSVGSDRFETEFRLRTRGGGWLWVLCRGKVMEWDAQGKPLRACGTHTDIALRKHMEAEVQRARTAAEAGSRAKTLFLANMSHEFRTPLNAVLGFTQLLLRSSELSAHHHKHLKVIEHSGDHLLRLLDGLLEVSSIEIGSLSLNPTGVNLSRLFEGLNDMFQVRAVAKGLHLSIATPRADVACVRCDESKLRQVLVNLTSNALKFTERGGVSIRSEVAVAADGSPQLIVSVEDTGCGIPEAEMDRLFEPFSRVSRERRAAEGAGLALYISHQFIRAMGGDLRVKSRVGKGTTFTFSVPIRHESGQALCPAAPPRVIGVRPKEPVYRVLIVDDDQHSREFLTHLLSDAGFETREAVNGAAAIALHARWKADVILMDTRMSGVDGNETTRMIRSQAGGEVKIITLSALTFPEDREKAVAAGADLHMAKPVRERDLFRALEQLLDIELVRQHPLVGSTSMEPNDRVRLQQQEVRLSLAPSLINRLHRALQIADFDQVAGLIDEVAGTNPQLAHSFRALAERFDIQGFLEVLPPTGAYPS